MTDIQKLTQEFKPNAVIIDTISNLKALGSSNEVQGILRILISFFKNQHITTLFTSLSSGQTAIEFTKTDEGISSLMDTWIYLQYIYGEEERNRGIGVLKSRGMAHSNQLREVILSDKGIRFLDVYKEIKHDKPSKRKTHQKEK
jgi:circadian clock protein KaiC